MPLVQAKCENCGGILQVDSSKKVAICPYCGTPYVVQDAINNYTTHIEHLHADVVNVNSDTSAKARLDAAEAFMKLHKYGDAHKAFTDVCLLTPQNYHGWWGQIRAITQAFSVEIEDKSKLEEIDTIYQSVLVFVPEHKKGEIEQKFLSYYQPLKEQNSRRCNDLKQRVRFIQDEIDKIQEAINELDGHKYPYVEYVSNGTYEFFTTLFLIGAFLALINLNIVFLILGGIPTVGALIWDTIIRSIVESSADSKKREDQIARDELYRQRAKKYEDLQQAQRELDRISS